MTKKEIKNELKLQAKTSWELLVEYIKEFGSDAEITEMQRTKWVIIDNMWNCFFPNEDY